MQETTVKDELFSQTVDCKVYECSRFDIEPPLLTDVDLAMDKAVWRKLDLRLLPTVAMFFFLSFLVRGIRNICVMLCTNVLCLGSNQPRQRSSGWIAETTENDRPSIQHCVDGHLHPLHSCGVAVESLAQSNVFSFCRTPDAEMSRLWGQMCYYLHCCRFGE